MTELTPFLKQIISTAGLSGYEAPVRRLIEDAWRPLTDELTVSRLGSLYGLKKSNITPRTEPCPRIVLAAHMDAVGLMVSGMRGEFLTLAEIGGLDPRVLPGQIVTVHGREDLPGVIIEPPDHLLPDSLNGKPIPLQHLMVETGLPANRLSKLVRTGDPISFAQEPIEMGENFIAGHSLDDRASIAAVTCCLDILQQRLHAWDVYAVATIQEEETFGGGFTSSYDLFPQIAIAIDVTFARGGNEGGATRTFPLGEGTTVAMGPNMHPAVYKKLKETAEKFEIPHHMETTSRHSGTDAYPLQVARSGVPTGLVSIPLRYMHTVVELISMKDVQRAGRLLAEFITSLTPDAEKELVWDE